MKTYRAPAIIVLAFMLIYVGRAAAWWWSDTLTERVEILEGQIAALETRMAELESSSSPEIIAALTTGVKMTLPGRINDCQNMLNMTESQRARLRWTITNQVVDWTPEFEAGLQDNVNKGNAAMAVLTAE